MLGAAIVPDARRRLKLDSRDLYALGAHRGGIDERWFSSTTNAANGPGTPEDEGLSYIAFDGKKILLKEAVETLGDDFLGKEVMARDRGWNVLCKFFDNLGPIPHHMHQRRSMQSSSGGRGNPRRTTSRRNTISNATTSRTHSWAWSREQPRTISGTAWNAGTRATTAF